MTEEWGAVLVVDDDVEMRELVFDVLKDRGHQISTSGSGQEALKALASDPPDLMMLDIWMPELDGIETLKRSREQMPSVQVLMMSGHGNIETAVKAIKLGAYDFIEKPLSLEKTVLVVRNALRQRHLEAENQALRAKVEEHQTLVGESHAMVQLQEQS